VLQVHGFVNWYLRLEKGHFQVDVVVRAPQEEHCRNPSPSPTYLSQNALIENLKEQD